MRGSKQDVMTPILDVFRKIASCIEMHVCSLLFIDVDRIFPLLHKAEVVNTDNTYAQ